MAGTVEDIIDEVSLGEFQSYLRVLTGVDPVNPEKPWTYIPDRHSLGSGIHIASQWIHDTFDSFGLDATFQTFDPAYGPNVIGELRGKTRPNDIYIIGAHYDTATVATPGCDDNGSGTAAAIMAGRIFSQYDFEATVRFVAFAGEEQWMVGSQAYAAAASAAGENILGVINYDMFLQPGFDNMNPNPDYDLDIGGNDGSQWLGQFLADQFALYTPIDVELHNDEGFVSDQWAFWPYGYSAVGLIENTPQEIWGGSNDAYHQPTDTILNPDYDWGFAVDSMRGGFAGLAKLAVPYVVPEPLSVALIGTLALSLFA